MCSVLAKWHYYLPPTLITQGCKLVWIKIDTSGPSVNQHDSNITEGIGAEFNSGHYLPETHQKSLTAATHIALEIHRQYLWKPFLLIPTETDEDSSSCFRRAHWFSLFSSKKKKKKRFYWSRPQDLDSRILIVTVIIHLWKAWFTFVSPDKALRLRLKLIVMSVRPMKNNTFLL